MSEEMIVRHCSPTLAGIKTGSLFNCPFESKETLNREINQLNRSLAKKGLRVLPLRYSGKKALIYIYRPARLRDDLLCDDVAPLLRDRGYQLEAPDRCVIHLIDRLRDEGGFPHEIGLFLGYPPEDVKGFIEKRECKLSGYWRVYSDVSSAKAKFDKFSKCFRIYLEQLEKGRGLEQLTVGFAG